MSLIRVWTDVGGRKPVALLAKIVSKKGPMYTICYMSVTEDRDHGRPVYRYEDETYEIDDDSICEYLNSSDETDAGYMIIEAGCFVRQADSDDDYVPSEEDEDDDDDVSEEDTGDVSEEENVDSD
jgi:hypothetical protein